MVAGASGIDLALLVVAADDGVMPQTREHVEILDLLGVRRGVVALNKVDLVDEEMRELALEELRDFLAGTGLAGAPLVPCSAATGEGVEEVRAHLLRLVGEASLVERPGSFFLAVQRTFAAAGFGCIVTGVPDAGEVFAGEELELLPARRKARVRAVEIYHQPAQRAGAGHRTALNLAGVHHEQVARGMVVAAPGIFAPTRHVAVLLRLLPRVRRPLKHAARVRLLTGTLEEMAAVFLLEGDALAPEEEALIEVRTVRPVTVRDGAPLILRSENAKETLGGGRVVSALEGPIGRRAGDRRDRLLRWAEALDSPDARLMTALQTEGPRAAAALARRCQLRPDWTAKRLEALCAAGELSALKGGTFLPAAEVIRATAAVRSCIVAMHAENPLLAALPRAAVRDRAGLDNALLDAALERIPGEVVAEGPTLRLAGHKVELDPELEAAADRVLTRLAEARFAPPSKVRLAEDTGLDATLVARALTFLEDVGAIHEVAPGVAYAKAVLDEGLRLLKALADRRGSYEPVDAKAVLGSISRKWLIPLLEFYDRLGATRRDGNARRFTRRGELLAREGIDAA